MTEKHMLCQLSHKCHAARQQCTLAPVCWMNSPPFSAIFPLRVHSLRSALRVGRGRAMAVPVQVHEEI